MPAIDYVQIQVQAQVQANIQVKHPFYSADKKKRASHWGAFFVAVLSVVFCGVVAMPALAVECPADRIDEIATVSQVIDGDTVRLKDGRLIRFIGVNTPELGRDGKPNEPLANTARLFVEALLKGATSANRAKLGIRYGAETKDRHGRMLAHVYTVDGISIEAELLSAGLAAQVVVPPNIWNRECYRNVENAARKENKGVWRHIYRPVPVQQLPRDTRGFVIISGQVKRVGESKRSIWLNFPRRPGEGPREGVAVQISRKDLDYFTEWAPKQLTGKQIVVRGWVHSYKKQLIMQLRHPFSLEIK